MQKAQSEFLIFVRTIVLWHRQRPQLRSVTIVTDEHTKETNLFLKSDHLIRKKIRGRDFTYIYFSLYIRCCRFIKATTHMLTIKSFDFLRTKFHFDYSFSTNVNIYKVSLRAKYTIIPSYFIIALYPSTVYTYLFQSLIPKDFS